MQAPTEFQGTVIGDLNKRKGLILNSETQGDDAIVDAQVWLIRPEKPGISSVMHAQIGSLTDIGCPSLQITKNLV